MKPTIEQLELIKFCKGYISTWENTNDISSPTHYNDLTDFINADLEEYPDMVKEDLENALCNLLDIIKNV